MKKGYPPILVIFISFMLITLTASAQDIIVKNDKTEIKSKVIEITDAVIKYKKFEMPDGPIYNIDKVNVFMIIYSNGTKEYMQGKVPDVPVNTTVAPSNPAPVKTPQKVDDALSIAIDNTGKSCDVEYTYFGHKNKDKPGKFGIGADIYSTISSNKFNGIPFAGGYYFFVSYKYYIDQAHDLAVWANAGYNISVVGDYFTSDSHVPSTTTGGFLWEAGASYYFNKWLGLTAYTSEGNSEWFGIVIRSW